MNTSLGLVIQKRVREVRWWHLGLLLGLALVIPVMEFLVSTGARGHQKVAKAKSDLSVLAAAIDQFQRDTGRYPTRTEGLSGLSVCPVAAPGWRGPYVREDLSQDPWGEPYAYRLIEGKRYRVISFGADRKPGGVGADADLEDGS